MVIVGENLAHKSTGTASDKIGYISLYQREKGKPYTFRKTIRQPFLTLEGTKNEHMIKLSKEIWYYLLNHNMPIAAEYLHSVLNTVADRKSRKKTDSSEWLLYPKFFQVVSRLLGSLKIDLFASRLYHRLPQYMV